MGVMHTTSPTRAQRQDGTVPSVLDLMHQTQLQQVTQHRYMLDAVIVVIRHPKVPPLDMSEA